MLEEATQAYQEWQAGDKADAAFYRAMVPLGSAAALIDDQSLKLRDHEQKIRDLLSGVAADAGQLTLVNNLGLRWADPASRESRRGADGVLLHGVVKSIRSGELFWRHYEGSWTDAGTIESLLRAGIMAAKPTPDPLVEPVAGSTP